MAADGIDVDNWKWLRIVDEWSWVAIVVLMIATIFFVVGPFLKSDPSSRDWRIFLFWLITALCCVILVGAAYLASYKCELTLRNFLSSIPAFWMWVWVSALVFMQPWVIFGTVLGEADMQGKTRWDILERVVLGLTAIWSCALATFGITVWDLLPACSK